MGAGAGDPPVLAPSLHAASRSPAARDPPGQVFVFAGDALVQQAHELAGEVWEVDSDALVAAQRRILLLAHLQHVQCVRVGLVGDIDAQRLREGMVGRQVVEGRRQGGALTTAGGGGGGGGSNSLPCKSGRTRAPVCLPPAARSRTVSWRGRSSPRSPRRTTTGTAFQNSVSTDSMAALWHAPGAGGMAHARKRAPMPSCPPPPPRRQPGTLLHRPPQQSLTHAAVTWRRLPADQHPGSPAGLSDRHRAQPRIGLVRQPRLCGRDAPAARGGGVAHERGALAGGHRAREVQQAQRHHAVLDLSDEAQRGPDLQQGRGGGGWMTGAQGTPCPVALCARTEPAPRPQAHLSVLIPAAAHHAQAGHRVEALDCSRGWVRAAAQGPSA